MDKNFRINRSKLLAVEGKDECNFFDSFFEHLGFSGIQTVNIGGKNKFRTEFPLLYGLEGFHQITHLGFVRDAEMHPAQSAFDSVCGILKEYQLPYPVKINSILHDSTKSVGIFIMPDNQGTGMLENLCLESITEMPVQSCLNSFIDCFQRNQTKEEKEVFNEPKARVQAYLATRSPIANSLGMGAQKKYWNFDHYCFDGIRQFLADLFSVKNK